MKHVILGNGNLGKDLELALLHDEHNEVQLLSRSNGWEWPGLATNTKKIDWEADVIWCTVGHGSIGEAERDPLGAMHLHHGLPMSLVSVSRPGTVLVFFSTDYIAADTSPQNPRALSNDLPTQYHLSKFTMERALYLQQRPRTVCVRVGSLYGIHKPERTLPGKLRRNAQPGLVMSLPENRICPTPTDWLAELLADNLMDIVDNAMPTFHHAAPMGSVTVRDFGSLVLGGQVAITSKGFDNLRPAASALECSFANVPHWKDLYGETLFSKDTSFM